MVELYWRRAHQSMAVAFGALLVLMAFPHVYVTVVALFELWRVQPQPDELLFLDFHTYDAFRWAFIAAHIWLAWVVTTSWRRAMPPALRALAVLLGIELGVVYSIIAFLRLRGIPLDVV